MKKLTLAIFTLALILSTNPIKSMDRILVTIPDDKCTFTYSESLAKMLNETNSKTNTKIFHSPHGEKLEKTKTKNMELQSIGDTIILDYLKMLETTKPLNLIKLLCKKYINTYKFNKCKRESDLVFVDNCLFMTRKKYKTTLEKNLENEKISIISANKIIFNEIYLSQEPSYKNIQKIIETKLYNFNFNNNISKYLIPNTKSNNFINNDYFCYIQNILMLTKALNYKKLFKNIMNFFYTLEALKKVDGIPNELAGKIMSFVDLKNVAAKRIYYKDTIYNSKWAKFFSITAVDALALILAAKLLK